MSMRIHRDSRKGTESLKKALPSQCHSTLVARILVCWEPRPNGPIDRAKRARDLRPEESRASVASGKFLRQLVSDKKAVMIIRATGVQWHGRGRIFFRRFSALPSVEDLLSSAQLSSAQFRIEETVEIYVIKVFCKARVTRGDLSD